MRLMFQLYKGKMRTIILTYPGFQSLPRGIKQMLVTSESFFFSEAMTAAANINHTQPKDAKIAPFPVVTGLGRTLEAFAGA
jgi:hypothetical protein